MSSEIDIYNFQKAFEVPLAQVLEDSDIVCINSQTDPEFQKERPRVELVLIVGPGRNKYFNQLGGKPEGGFNPEQAYTGQIQLTVITESNPVTQAQFVSRVRFAFQTVCQTIAQYLSPYHFVQRIAPSGETPTYHDENGERHTALVYEIFFSASAVYVCEYGESQGTQTPVITSAAQSSWGSFPAGKYVVQYSSGAMKYGGAFNWQVNRLPDAHRFRVVHSNGLTTIDAPGNSTEYTSQSLCEQYNAGQYIEFDHTGGTITVFLDDAPYNDNHAGSPNPTFELFPIVCGFKQIVQTN